MINETYYISIAEKLIKEGKSKNSIISELLTKKIEENDADYVFEKATKNLSKQRILWFVGAIGILIIWFLIPVSIYSFSPSLITIIGAASFSGLVFMFLELGDSFTQVVYTIVSFFVFAIFFIFLATSAQSKDLAENGVTVKAEIINTSSYRAKRSRIYNAKINFKLLNGQNTIKTISISKHEYNNFYKGQIIKVVYSKKNLDNVRIYQKTEEELEIEKHIKAFEISINQLTSFISKDSKLIEEELNAYSEGWILREDSIWINEKKETFFKVNSQNSINLLSNLSNIKYFEEELKNTDFKKNVYNHLQRNYEYESNDFIYYLSVDTSTPTILMKLIISKK